MKSQTNCVVYEIRVDGRLSHQWAAWFDGMKLHYEANETVLTGPVPDQAALHGLLIKVRDLGLTLISLQQRRA
jgi:hypothetical protein